MEQPANNAEANNDQDRISQFANSVFNVDLLLDMILDYVIHDDKGKTIIFAVENCRLVSMTWLLSVNRVLRKSQNPLFVFNLCGEHSDGRRIEQVYGENYPVKILKSAIGSHLGGQVPPYAIVTRGLPTLQNLYIHKSIFDCLTICGSGLIKLDLRIFEIPPSSLRLNKNFFLPRLTTFTVHLYREHSERGLNNMKDKIDFIQSVFDGCGQLKSFTLNSYFYDDAVPDYFGSLTFPSSITNLDLNSPLNDCKLQTLVNSSLPNLKTLKFLVGTKPFKHGLLTGILQKHQKTLESLHVGCEDNMQNVQRPTPVQLPLMQKLKNLYTNTPLFELDGNGTSLQQLVPMLNQVTLCRQTRPTLRNWTAHSCFPSVTFLKVSMVNNNAAADRLVWNSFANIDLSTIQSLHMAFPNVKELNIVHVDTDDMTTLLFIMKEMINLQCLRICLENEEELESSDIWDAALIGIPQESVGLLREAPDLWEGLENQNNVSIRNLIDLQTLELDCRNESMFSVISGMAFHYAFFKMPKLSNLILKGGFRTTSGIAQRWESEERTIETDYDVGDDCDEDESDD